MRQLWTSLALVLGLGLLLAHNNCDVSPYGTGEEMFSSQCFGEDCYPQPDASRLSVEASDTNFRVQSGMRYFDFGGGCNDGGLDKAVVFWELIDPEGRVLNRFAPEDYSCGSGQSVASLCGRSKPGNFWLRVGGWSGNLYGEHVVRLKIVGFDKDCRPFENGLAGEQSVYLTPSGI